MGDTDQDGRKRHEQGRITFARCIRLLLARNDLSHQDLKDLAAWANPDGRNWLSTSQVSYLRTLRLKAVGPRTLDALGQLNLALAHLAGDDSRKAQAMGTLPPPPRHVAEKLASPFYLRDPDTDLPMDAGDLYRVWIGRATPEGADALFITDDEAQAFSFRLAELVQRWCQSRDALLFQCLPSILDLYPVDAQPRIERLRRVVAGIETFSAADLQEELRALAAMVGAMTGQELSDRALLSMLDGSPAAA